MLTTEELHQKVLYPVARIKTQKAGGSGVVVYSGPDPKHKGSFINIALTCEHVVDDAIKLREEWDTVLKKQRRMDYFEEVSVELFDYVGSRLISANATPAEIIAYDKHHDLAAVRLLNPRPLPFIASIIPKANIEGLRLFDPVLTSGCSLLHNPFANKGELTYLREIIEQKTYLMYNAPSIFGNSGGGVFHGGTGDLLGLVSRITVIQLGFGVDVQTWMGFGTHPDRLYEFFTNQELQFIYDPADDYHSALERRKKRQREATRQLLVEPGPPPSSTQPDPLPVDPDGAR